MSVRIEKLFCFGLGYTAESLAHAVFSRGAEVAGTCRTGTRRSAFRDQGYDVVIFDGEGPSDVIQEALQGSTHVLLSIPPGEMGDRVFPWYRDALLGMKRLKWLGYLSTTGVYGDHQGGWVDETTPPDPENERQALRVKAEKEWLTLYEKYGFLTHVFRLAGIYGPGRNVLEQLEQGRARRIYKENQFFSRIHVEDIVRILLASMESPMPGEIYNVCDDEPAPAHEVVTYGAKLLGIEPPPLVPVEKADLSAMARSFYQSSRKVRNNKVKQRLGIELMYPTYREGLQNLQKSVLT